MAVLADRGQLDEECDDDDDEEEDDAIRKKGSEEAVGKQRAVSRDGDSEEASRLVTA